LAFLCVSLVIFTPLGVVRDIILALQDSDQNPIEKAFGLGFSMGFGAFALFAGISLWRIRPRAVLIAKAYLFAYLGLSLLVATWVPFDPELGALFTTREIVQAIVYPAVWRTSTYRSGWKTRIRARASGPKTLPTSSSKRTNKERFLTLAGAGATLGAAQ
jgi:hypothetical protein